MEHTLALPIALLLAPLAVLHAAGAPAKKPNILYVLTDQWRGNATGYAGVPNVKTPRLDRLAASSLHFRNAVSVLPVCTPYRASLMTGRYPTSCRPNEMLKCDSWHQKHPSEPVTSAGQSLRKRVT